MHDTYHCFLGDGFTWRELFSPCCTSYDWWWILILPISHIYCLYVKRVSRSIEHLRSHVEVEVTPAMSQYFSQRAIVSLHNSTSSKQRWHLKKKMANCYIYISRSAKVLLQCFCCSFTPSEPPHEVRARPSVSSGPSASRSETLAWWRRGLNCRPYDQWKKTRSTTWVTVATHAC